MAGYCSHRGRYGRVSFSVFGVTVHAHGTVHVAIPVSFSASSPSRFSPIPDPSPIAKIRENPESTGFIKTTYLFYFS